MKVVINASEEAWFVGEGVIVFIGSGFAWISVQEHSVGPFFEDFACEGRELSVALCTDHKTLYKVAIDHRPSTSVPGAVFADSFPEAFGGEEGVISRKGGDGEGCPEGFWVEEIFGELGDLFSRDWGSG